MSIVNDIAVDTITGAQVQEWISFYKQKNQDYQSHGEEFGVRGEVHNMGKKMGKLKRALWDGEPLVGEQPEEILLDMVGHCMQALYLLRDQPLTEGVDYEVHAVALYGPPLQYEQLMLGDGGWMVLQWQNL